MAAVALAVLAAGCAPVYLRSGVPDDQRHRDEAACTHMVTERIPGGLIGDVYITVERVDRSCMEKRGYRMKQACVLPVCGRPD